MVFTSGFAETDAEGAARQRRMGEIARERAWNAHPGSQLSRRVQRRDRILRDVQHHARILSPATGSGRHREPERRVRCRTSRLHRPPAPHRRGTVGDHRQRVRRDGLGVHRLDGGTSGNRRSWRRTRRGCGTAMPCSASLDLARGNGKSRVPSPRPGAPKPAPRRCALAHRRARRCRCGLRCHARGPGTASSAPTPPRRCSTRRTPRASAPCPRDRRIGFMTISGGAGVMMADEAAAQGLEVPPMPQAAQRRLKEMLSFSDAAQPRGLHRTGVQRAPAPRGPSSTRCSTRATTGRSSSS